MLSWAELSWAWKFFYNLRAGSLALHWYILQYPMILTADSEDPDQTAQNMPEDTLSYGHFFWEDKEEKQVEATVYSLRILYI